MWITQLPANTSHLPSINVGYYTIGDYIISYYIIGNYVIVVTTLLARIFNGRTYCTRAGSSLYICNKWWQYHWSPVVVVVHWWSC